MTEIEHYLEIFRRDALPVIRRAGEYILGEAKDFDRDHIEEKDKNSLVSYVDKTAEQMLVQSFRAIFPDSGFITEEDVTTSEEKEMTWIIDPLDGTTNFLQGIPCYSVSVALQYRSELIAGAIYDPVHDEMFLGLLDQGAYLNGKRIQPFNSRPHAKCLIGTGFPYSDMSLLEPHMAILRDVLTECRGMRRLGSAALDMAYVAASRIDGFYEHTLNIYDVAAGIVIVREQGGLVTDYNGKHHLGRYGDIVAGSPHIHGLLIDIIGRHLG